MSVCLCVRKSVCVCVCVREREREREREKREKKEKKERQRKIERQRDRESVCLCVISLFFAGMELLTFCVFLDWLILLWLEYFSTIFCMFVFVDRYCLNLDLSWDILFSPSMMIEICAGYSSRGSHLADCRPSCRSWTTEMGAIPKAVACTWWNMFYWLDFFVWPQSV
jgi:hypothetical protein